MELKRLTNVWYDAQRKAWQSHFFNTVGCCNSTVLLDKGLFTKKNNICNKILCLALEHIENCRSRVSFVTFICLDGQILAQKFANLTTVPFGCVHEWGASICAPSFLVTVRCKWALQVFRVQTMSHFVSRNLNNYWLTIFLSHTYQCKWPAVIHLHQHISDTVTKNLVEVEPNTMTSFWNMSTASAPMNITDTSVKYWIRADTATQPPYTAVWLIPLTKTISIQNRAVQSWTWNMVVTRPRNFLYSGKLFYIKCMARHIGNQLWMIVLSF